MIMLEKVGVAYILIIIIQDGSYLLIKSLMQQNLEVNLIMINLKVKLWILVECGNIKTIHIQMNQKELLRILLKNYMINIKENKNY